MQLSDLPGGVSLFLAIVVGLIVAAGLFKDAPTRFVPLPYRKKHLMSEAEKRFFRELEDLVRTEPIRISPRCGPLFGRTYGSEWLWRSFAKISQKHVDFLFVDTRTLEPLMGVELDDASHMGLKVRERDGFVDAVFEAAELPLHRIRAAAGMIRTPFGIRFSEADKVHHPKPTAIRRSRRRQRSQAPENITRTPSTITPYS